MYCRPGALTGRLFQRAVRTAAELDDQHVPLDNGRAADSESALHHAELGLGINLPEKLPVGRPDAVKDPFYGKGVHAVTIHHRAGALAVMYRGVVIGLVSDRVLEFPQKLAALTV